MQAQTPTIGLLEYDLNRVSDGYLLFCPYLSSDFYLINNCGEKINTWQINLSSSLKMGYLDDEGNLLIQNNTKIRKFDWFGNLIWEFRSQDYNIASHHDFEIMPNGNILTIANERIEYDEAIAMGFLPENIPNGFTMIDGLYEFKHLSDNNFELVWKWNFKDHVVQDRDEDLDTYGDVTSSPRKLDLNFNIAFDNFDWLHCNGVDYNETLDQVIVSSRNTSEIYIIDHSTSIEEAASSTGGTQGFGGDFLWRWGKDPKLRAQHDPNWIPNAHPNGGFISVYNNFEENQIEPYSSVKIIDPSLDSDGNYQLDSLNQFLPQEAYNTISGEDLEIFSPFMSGTDSQSNGNFIVCEGTSGTFYELTSEGELIWKYQNPISNVLIPQFIPPSDNLTFNIKKYPPDFPGFQGKDLTPNGLIENENPVSEDCILSTSTKEISQSESNVEQIQIFALSGKRIVEINKPKHSIDIQLPNGSYIFQFKSKDQFVNKLINIIP